MIFLYNLATKIKHKQLDTFDTKILKDLKNNSESAFDELFRKYYKKLVFFAIKILKNQDTATEVVQDLFVNFWEKRHQLEPKISLQAYLYRSVYNNCVHLSKKEKKFQGDELSLINEPSEDFNNLLENNELEVRIYDLIEQLPPECKKIFKMSRFDELKYQQIADQLNLSVKTVETQMSRALKFLRQKLWDYVKMLIFIW
jgi:RNA polymerase sigma-70 factor, ECF subfamily